jgi:hypothetical protein
MNFHISLSIRVKDCKSNLRRWPAIHFNAQMTSRWEPLGTFLTRLQGIERHMLALDTADRQEGELAQVKSARLKDEIAWLKRRACRFKVLEAAVHAALDKQISLTLPDARSMATGGKDTGFVGDKVKAAAAHRLRTNCVCSATGQNVQYNLTNVASSA